MINLQLTHPFSFYVCTCSCTWHMAENIRRLAHAHVLTFLFRVPSYRYNLDKHVEQTHISGLILGSVERPWAGLFLSRHSLDNEENKKVSPAINSGFPPALAPSLSLRTDLVWEKLCSLTFSTHIDLNITLELQQQVRSRAPSLWPLLHNTWNPIKAMKSKAATSGYANFLLACY